MPVSAERALVGDTLPLDAGQERGIERVALRAVAALARATALAFFARRTVWARLGHRNRKRIRPTPRVAGPGYFASGISLFRMK